MSAARTLPCSEACERNKGPILSVLEDVLEGCSTVLEVGGGTGQHAVHFASHMPELTWLSSETGVAMDTLRRRIKEAGLDNLPPPLELDVTSPLWPVESVDAAYSANTAHILPWTSVEFMFAGVGQLLHPRGVFVLYGPFKYDGEHTSSTNARFDTYLQEQDPQRGIRDMSDLLALAQRCSLKLEDDRVMPANNRILIWRKTGGQD